MRPQIADLKQIVENADITELVNWLGRYNSFTFLEHLDELLVRKLLSWLYSSLGLTDKELASAIFYLLGNLLQMYPIYSREYLELIFHPNNITSIEKLVELNSDKFFECLVKLIKSLQCLTRDLQEEQISKSLKQIYETAANFLVKILYNKSMNIETSNASHFVYSSLKFLQNVVVLCPPYAKTFTAELFGICQACMQCGITGPNVWLFPKKIYPSQRCLYNSRDSEAYAKESVTRNGGKLSKTRKIRNIAKVVLHQETINKQNFITDINYLSCIASDGDSSDGDNCRNLKPEVHARLVKVRMAAINLLAAVCRNLERHMVYGYYYVIFPNELIDVNNNLISLAKSDPSTHCRAAALQVGAHILTGSKNYFSQAECSKRNCINFLPFSQSLGSMVTVIYNVLFAILSTESSTFVLTQALKCLSVLVQATPFHKLEFGIATEIVNQTRKLINHCDCNIQFAALMVMEFLASTSKLTTEIIDIMGLPHLNAETFISNTEHLDNMISDELNEEGYEEFIEIEESQNSYNKSRVDAHLNNRKTHESWLLQHIIENLNTNRQQSKVPVSIYVESINVLSALSCHFALLFCHLQEIIKVFQYALEDSLLDVQLSGARCLEKFSYEMSRYISSTCDLNCIRSTDSFWGTLLPKVNILISDSAQQNSSFKNYLCGSLANIGIVLYERLPYAAKISLFSCLSGVSNNSAEDTIVRAAAIRALAVHVAFPSIRKNLVFVENTADLTLQFINDRNLSVRVRVLWAMANVSDALVANCNVEERVSFDLLTRLIEASKNACNDNDKVRCNAVRALGNFLSILTVDNFDEYVCRKMFNKSIQKLVHCITSSSNAKVKWNSYYAVGNIFRNNTIFSATEKYSDLEWQNPIYTSICHTIVHHSNFKVRISAAIAIKHIKKRLYIENYLNLIWSSLLAAIENSQNSINLEEHEHSDNLQEQLCLAVCHIIAISKQEDFPVLQIYLLEKSEIVSHVWLRVSNRMIPEKSAPLLSCSILLQERMKNWNLKSDQLSAMAYIAKTLSLQEIFSCSNATNVDIYSEIKSN